MKRLAWHLVLKLQGHVTQKKGDMFGSQRKKQGQQRHDAAISTRTQTSTSSNVVWKSTVTTMMWQTTVNCFTRGQRRPGKHYPRPPPLTSWNADSASCRHQPCDWCCRRDTLMRYIQRVHPNKSPLKIWDKRGLGHIKGLPKFFEYPLLSQGLVKLRTSIFLPKGHDKIVSRALWKTPIIISNRIYNHLRPMEEGMGNGVGLFVAMGGRWHFVPVPGNDAFIIAHTQSLCVELYFVWIEYGMKKHTRLTSDRAHNDVCVKTAAPRIVICCNNLV